MQSFIDSAGRSWEIVVDVPTRALVSSRTGLDLLLIGAGDKHTVDLLLSPANSFNVICAMTEKQRETRNLTLTDFGAALNSQPILDGALRAILEATFDFFPNQQAQVLRKAMLTALEIQREDLTEVMTEAEKVVNSPDFKQKVREELYRERESRDKKSSETPSKPATESQENSESTSPEKPGESST